MNKEINELDRMKIGVREWAVEETLSAESNRDIRAEDLIEYAQKLEGYVLKGIKD